MADVLMAVLSSASCQVFSWSKGYPWWCARALADVGITLEGVSPILPRNLASFSSLASAFGSLLNACADACIRRSASPSKDRLNFDCAGRAGLGCHTCNLAAVPVDVVGHDCNVGGGVEAQARLLRQEHLALNQQNVVEGEVTVLTPHIAKVARDRLVIGLQQHPVHLRLQVQLPRESVVPNLNHKAPIIIREIDVPRQVQEALSRQDPIIYALQEVLVRPIIRVRLVLSLNREATREQIDGEG
eukprot:CAMPEP_0206252022 /NCGR_PEP_ID=MMETSP0047_2-20121206/22346_1 /ASSEMBLY_ACC=CAM_ASM_000192 /TAXON_ID=195065 /ORGANISM="Chroomonas mesostigmatica_cf, Strain CCMP1168" /LENGTH=243 /DNA_ID=CAMNT_0053678035 /DNA_START=355 /DNA_END=1081 /DNA_ORIENTATION=-